MQQALSNFEILPCEEKDFEKVTQCISLLELDNNDLRCEQFLVAKLKGEVIGFGRLRRYPTCEELCSLGVIEPYRFKGLGTEISRRLVALSKKPLYLVAIIPSFFERLGFVITIDFPNEIATKMAYCKSSLPVAETYVAMQLK